MKLEKSIFVLLFPLLYALLRHFVPTLPLELDSVAFEALFAWALAQLGVVIVEPKIRAFFVKRGFKGFIKK